MAVKYKVNVKEGTPGIDPTTFAPVIYHPLVYFDVLDMKIYLKQEIQEWLTQTCKDRWIFDIEEGNYYIYFLNDADVTLFRLQWL